MPAHCTLYTVYDLIKHTFIERVTFETCTFYQSLVLCTHPYRALLRRKIKLPSSQMKSEYCRSRKN